ncbi:MAG TPA: MBL fold metallo-hydrolase, partial [Stellaceae bacterium]|nr:MBL fold metallo-hydrolase [Stellaceae bacterium]
MKVRFIGTGDAFGSGGRFNTCFLLEGAGGRLLVDFGASSLVALKQSGILINDIDAVLISHLHGDHFGGLPFLMLDCQHMSRRDRPLSLYGPPGLAQRLREAQEALFPGSSTMELRFPFELVEMALGRRYQGNFFAVTPSLANHSAGAPPYSLRVEC